MIRTRTALTYSSAHIMTTRSTSYTSRPITTDSHSRYLLPTH